MIVSNKKMDREKKSSRLIRKTGFRLETISVVLRTLSQLDNLIFSLLVESASVQLGAAYIAALERCVNNITGTLAEQGKERDGIRKGKNI